MAKGPRVKQQLHTIQNRMYLGANWAAQKQTLEMHGQNEKLLAAR